MSRAHALGLDGLARHAGSGAVRERRGHHQVLAHAHLLARAPGACGRPARSRRRRGSRARGLRNSAGTAGDLDRARAPGGGRRAPRAARSGRRRRAPRARRPRPGATSSVTSSNAPGRLRLAHAQHGLADVARAVVRRRRRSRARGRPSARSAAAGRTRRPGPPPTVCPSRRTVTRSASAKISPSRCETKIVATPSPRSRRTSPKSASTSSSVSELVGSSRISTRASIESARAISTICCWSGRSRRTGMPGSRSRSSRASASRARRRVARQSIEAGAPHHAVPEEDVLGDREVGRERRLLRDRRDALAQRLGRVAEARRLARRTDLAAVGLHLPREDLQQRRLARAVLADAARAPRPDRRSGGRRAGRGRRRSACGRPRRRGSDRCSSSPRQTSVARPPGRRSVPGGRTALLDRLDLRVPARGSSRRSPSSRCAAAG